MTNGQSYVNGNVNGNGNENHLHLGEHEDTAEPRWNKSKVALSVTTVHFRGQIQQYSSTPSSHHSRSHGIRERLKTTRLILIDIHMCRNRSG